jgi:hypothetical protein
MMAKIRKAESDISRNFPTRPWGVLRFLIIFILVGTLPTILIQILSSHPFWDYIRPWFSTEAWHYLSWWLTIAPEPVAGFFGIFLAFAVERKIQRNDFHKRVRQIAPYIYLELIENYHLVREATDFNDFNYQQKQFNVSAWGMFKEDVAKWREINVVPLQRIYYNLEKANRILSVQFANVPHEAWTARRNAEILLLEQITLYEDWYKRTPKALEEFQRVYEKYQIATHQEDIMKKVSDWVIKRGLLSTNTTSQDTSAREHDP